MLKLGDYRYPFAASFCAKDEEAGRPGRYGPVTSDEYRAYCAALSD
jgi:hypothetical protein